MAAEKIKFSKLENWVENYKLNLTNDTETRNVVFKIEELKELIAYCENHPQVSKINCIRFYMVRQNDYANGSRHKVFRDQTQISLVAVPVFEFENNEYDKDGNYIPGGNGRDVTDGDEIMAVYPTYADHEHGGLCPYNCKGSLNHNDLLPVQ